MSSIELSFENPWFLLLAIPSFAIILLPFLRLPARRRKTFRKIAPVVLHTIVVLLLILIISGFNVVRDLDEQAVMLLVDLSDSTGTVQSEIEDHTQQLLELIDKNTPVGVVAFGKTQLYTVKFDEDRSFSVTKVDSDATDIDGALEYASSLLPTDKAGHIILLSDGKETDGDANNTAHYLASRGVRIDAVYFDTTQLSTAEVQISTFASPDGAYVGDVMTFAATIQSNTDTEVTLSLYDDGELVTNLSQNITSGSNMIELNCEAESAGIHAYQLALQAQEDTLLQNNTSYAYVNVASQSAVLIIADTIGNGEKLAQLLSADNTVTTVTAPNAPNSIIDLCDYDEVILSNVDYSQLPSDYDALLETYVGVYGRSLLAVGGENTFMYGGMEGTALEEMLPVTFTLQEDAEGKSVALMLVLDCSNSMSQQSMYLSVAKQGAIKCVEAMSQNDYVGVISFNSTAYLKSPLIEASDSNKDSLTRIISALTTNRGTYYTEALEMAQEELKNSNADIKHIIFLSDGQPSDYGYSQAVESASNDGITVSTIGLGYSSSILESMAEAGSGRYYYVSSASDLPDIMLSETEQVTVSSLITGEFTPVVTVESDLSTVVGVSTLPNIYGYLGTTIKDGATAYIVTDEDRPIYASWAFGLGTVACFTSDLNGQWSAGWLADDIGIATTLAMVSTTIDDVHHNSSISAEIAVRGQTTDITVITAGNAEDTLNLTVASDSGTEAYVPTQIDPSVFTASVKTADPGVYELMITQTDSSGTIVDYLEAAITVSYSSEYNAFADSGEPLLSTLCSYSDGGIYTDMQQLANVQVSSISIVYNPMIAFAVISAFLMLADIAIRKLRWKDIRNYFITHKSK